MKPRGSPAVKSASRVLDLLECLGVSKQPLSFLELSRELRIPKSSLFHLLGDLTARKYVEHLPDVSRYRLGPALAELLKNATGERSLPPEPEPFDPLPPRSPGMWPEGEEAGRRPDILVDDEGHIDDLIALVRVTAESVGVDAQETLRPWLAKEFFPLHIKRPSRHFCAVITLETP